MNQLEISAYRPILFSTAYRLVGCSAVAEDMVQDTFLKWLKMDQEKVVNAKAYLLKSVTNSCLNYLESFKQKKEDLLENIGPNLSMSFFKINPDISNIDFKHELTHALAQLYKKLPPTERAVFVLKELFNFDYSELTDVLGKKTDNCRQLFCRAQKKLGEEKVRFNVEADRVLKIAEDFKKATLGEFSGLIDSLKRDIHSEESTTT
ncbi:MAG: sigma-70 family RNA polymerase sigma factor [Cyclobacteriaceae bacterium]